MQVPIQTTIVCWVFDSRVNEFNPERSRRYRSIRENRDSSPPRGSVSVGAVRGATIRGLVSLSLSLSLTPSDGWPKEDV